MKKTQNPLIFQELDTFISNYEGGVREKLPGLSRSQYQVIKMAEFYSDSKYMGYYIGNKDQNGRPVPFYNVVNYRVTLAKVGTDLDIKNFNIVSDNPKHAVKAMLLNREAYQWMKETDFSKTLNVMGDTRPRYGGYLIKKVEEKGDMRIEVIRWSNVATDQNDILRGPIVEKHIMSPVEIKRKEKVWKNVNDVLRAHKKESEKDETDITVFEILGEFPKSVFNDSQEKESSEEDEYTFSLQKYYVAVVGEVKFLMFAEEVSGEISDYYEYLAWDDNGYGLGRGVIEEAEESQVWTNDTVINETIAMSLAGRVGIVTTSKTLGSNVLEHDHGKVYELAQGEEFQTFGLAPAALGNYQNEREKWRMQGDNATSSYMAATGEQPPANTPYAQTALLNQVASKPLDYKREEWGIHLSKVFEKWVLPHIIKKLKKKHVLVSEFTDTELEIIDQSFAAYNSNKDIIKHILKTGELPTQAQQAELIDGYKKHLKKDGKKRYLEIPEGYFDDIEAKVTVLITNEQKDKAVMLQSITTLMQTYIQSFNPTTGEFGVIADPILSRLFGEAVELAGAGVSPASFGIGGTPKVKAPTPTPAMPAMPPMGTPVK